MSTWRRTAATLAALSLTAGLAVAVVSSTDAAQAAIPANGQFHAVTPTRIFDTRNTSAGAVKPGGVLVLTVADDNQTIDGVTVPSVATAIALHVTVAGATGTGYLTVFPDSNGGTQAPLAANLNFTKGQTIPNTVIVRTGHDDATNTGKIGFYNGSKTGTVQIIVDEFGYFTGTNNPAGAGSIGVVAQPVRLLDTRQASDVTAGKPLATNSSVNVSVVGSGKAPAGISAVIMNLTAVGPTATGFVTAYATGSTRPVVSSGNFSTGETIGNLVIAPVNSSGQVTLYNGATGSVHLVADLEGYVLPGDPIAAGTFGAITPTRMADTRDGTGDIAKLPIAPGDTRTFFIAVPSIGVQAGVPVPPVTNQTETAILNVTAVNPTAPGYLTVYGPNPQPTVANLNFSAGQTIPNMAITTLSGAGTIKIFNGSKGTVDVVVDAFGYLLGADAPLPAVASTSRYVQDITGRGAAMVPNQNDVNTMFGEGCNDAAHGSTLTILEFGAQSNTNSPASSPSSDVLSQSTPGVRLTGGNASAPTRLTYADLTVAINAYTQGFSDPSCNTGQSATIAIGTNNDGDFTAYPANQRGADWATLINSLATHPGITLAAADDIESNFDSTAAQAKTWETNYFNTTPANLIYNGALTNCPSTYGATTDCGPVFSDSGQNVTWLLSDYVALTEGINSVRTRAVPQVFFESQAIQWANLDIAAAHTITFAGSLTQNGVNCGTTCAMTPAEGWAALNRALSTVTTPTPAIPAMTDLQVDPAS